MTYAFPKLTVSESLDQHGFIVARVLRELLDQREIDGRPVEQAVRLWYERHKPRVRSMLRHEEPLYTACAIISREDQAIPFEAGAGRDAYLRVVEVASQAWLSDRARLLVP